MTSIRPYIEELERFHAWSNKEIFRGELKANTIITVASRGRRNALGWFGPDRWRTPANPAHEILISAEDAKRPPLEVLGTLLHEMVHQYNEEHKIRDTDKTGRVHNKKFRNAAESFGLVCKERDKKIGFGFTNLSVSTNDLIQREFKPNQDAFNAYRPGELRSKAPTKLKKWSCGCTNVRVAVEDFNAKCLTCGNIFEEEEKE